MAQLRGNGKKKETRSMGDEDEEPLSPMARVFQLPDNDCCVITIIVSIFTVRCGASWIKTRVNVEDHVIVADVDMNEIGEDGESFVEDYISRLTMLPLNKSKPLWDIHILNVKTSDAEAVCVIRSHHSLGDGTSLMSLLLACTSHEDTVTTIPPQKGRKMVDKDKGSRILRSDSKTPLKGDTGVENNQKKFCHRVVPIDDIKLIKEPMNMTINDVLLGITQAALSRYLEQFPGKIRLRAGVFVNLRPDTGIQAKSTMDRKKNSLQPALLYSNTAFILDILGAKASAIIFNRLVSNITTFISNMIGPKEEISFHGHPIAYIAPSVYGHAHALSIHFLSYAEKMVISIGVDPTAVPNPHKLCDRGLSESDKSSSLGKRITLV
ncbi:hypothetical protein IGI04_015819 [Brassica rapa subsp. trilocularis]|uniref:Diacylglycerol O-acyltransferase n=1 Tax=Brassica rapa subsp. trilocularis TaxID=1813537 RepID=A0ABQ7MRD7_BRACM|nr:hypothetical protein IGI04_015819 [Brassica rapa subsp. trilocularis]